MTESIEPACWSWAVPPRRTVADLQAEIEAANELATDPDARRNPEVARYLLADGGGRQQFDAFHDGRCAVCGAPPFADRLVDDHDHATGLVRGRLCRSCNLREGHGHDGVFDLYRDRPPSEILGFRTYYVGFDWPQGWWKNEVLARRLTGNPAWARVA